MLRKFEEDALFAINFILGVSGTEDGHNGSFDTKARLNNVRYERCATIFGTIFHAFAGVFLDVH